MKKNLKFIVAALLIFVGISCSDTDEQVGPNYLDVSYVNVAGTWQMTSWRGTEQGENPYMYLVLDRKEHKFEIYQNVDSGKSRHITGTYTLTVDKNDNVVIKGVYDHASGFWNHDYFVSHLTADQMTWTITDDATDISVYTRCAAIPEDIINGTRSL